MIRALMLPLPQSYESVDIDGGYLCISLMSITLFKTINRCPLIY